jgi:hypothetical protein
LKARGVFNACRVFFQARAHIGPGKKRGAKDRARERLTPSNCARGQRVLSISHSAEAAHLRRGSTAQYSGSRKSTSVVSCEPPWVSGAAAVISFQNGAEGHAAPRPVPAVRPAWRCRPTNAGPQAAAPSSAHPHSSLFSHLYACFSLGTLSTQAIPHTQQKKKLGPPPTRAVSS